MCPPLVFGAQKKPGLDRVKAVHGAAHYAGTTLETQKKKNL